MSAYGLALPASGAACSLWCASPSGAFHFADVMGLTRVTYMVSISSSVRSLDSLSRKKTATARAAQHPAKTRPYSHAMASTMKRVLNR